MANGNPLSELTVASKGEVQMKGKDIGVDSETKQFHSVVVTPANVHDSQVPPDLLHGEKTRVSGDSAYAGQTEATKEAAPKAADFKNKKASRHRQKCARDDRDECIGQPSDGENATAVAVIRPQYGDSPRKAGYPMKSADLLRIFAKTEQKKCNVSFSGHLFRRSLNPRKVA